MELRSYGWLGTLAVPRPAMGYSAGGPDMAQHAGQSYIRPPMCPWETPIVSNYTTYSYSRDLRPYPDPVDSTGNTYRHFRCTASQRPWWFNPPRPLNPWSIVWPPFPGHVAALPDISSYTNIANPEQAAENLVIAATNIATAMETLRAARGTSAYLYSPKKPAPLPPIISPSAGIHGPRCAATGGPAYKLIGGPSFIDQTGLCLRTGQLAAKCPAAGISSPRSIPAQPQHDLTWAMPPSRSSMKPPLSIHFNQPPPAGTGKAILDDCAIELYNPYNVALSLDDFKLNVNGTDIDFTGKNLWVPARGYFVLTKITGQLDTSPTAIPATATHTDAGPIGGCHFRSRVPVRYYLMRKYSDRTGARRWAAVDQYDVSQIRTFPALRVRQ